MKVPKNKAENGSPIKTSKSLKKVTKITKENRKKSLDSMPNQITKYFFKTSSSEIVDLTNCTQIISSNLTGSTKIESPLREKSKENNFIPIKCGSTTIVKTEEKVLHIFPSSSHIIQHNFTNFKTSKYNFKLNSFDSYSNVEITFNLKKNKILNEPNPILPLILNVNHCTNVKSSLKELKTNFPNVPINKIYKNLCTRNPKNSDKNFMLWTEKYKPKDSEGIIGQNKLKNDLKKFLENWNITTKYSDSECEFDCDENGDSSLENTIILEGPLGCGKSTLVYAICNELNYNVIEINASSLRTGKKITLDLQEATQSYQVHTKKKSPFKCVKSAKKPKLDKLKMCVIFIEDIDIVFDQDDGFIVSLSQITSTTKCPIILTTSDVNSNFVRQFLSYKSCKILRAKYSQNMAVYLKIICLIEGFCVDSEQIRKFLLYYNNDLRKCLLNLQYFVQSQEKSDKVIQYNTNRNNLDNIFEDINTNFYDLLSILDISFIKHNKSVKLTDSLELTNDIRHYNDILTVNDFLDEVIMSNCQNNTIKSCSNDISKTSKALTDCVELSNYLDRKAMSLDYMPNLRNIARCEKNRYNNNSKRNNRFRHYFRELSSFCFNEDLSNSICDTFK